jgi:hypothetical protein
MTHEEANREVAKSAKTRPFRLSPSRSSSLRGSSLLVRHSWALRIAAAALAAAAAALAGGCGDSAEEDAKAVAAAVEGIAAVPASADVILGADVGALARSALIERAIAGMLTADPGLREELQKLLGGCGTDPVRDVSSVLLAMDNPEKEGAGADRVLLVATGHLSEAKLTSCVGKHMSQLGGKLVEKTEGGRVTYQADAPPGRLDVWFAFGSPETLIVSSSGEFLAEAMGTGPRVAGDASMAQLIKRARTPGAALWAAGRVPPAVGKGLAAATGGKVGAPRAMFGHVAAETGLTVELGVELASAEEAKAALSLAQNQLRLLTQVAQKWRLGRSVAKVSTEAVGPTLFFRANLTDEELRQALAPIDRDAGPDQNPAPTEGNQGAQPHGQGDASPGGQAPLRKQGKAD